VTPEEQARSSEESLARIASLRECGGSRDDLIRRFLADAAGEAGIADVQLLLRGEEGKAHHYFLERGVLHRREVDEVDQRPFGRERRGAETFTGGIPDTIRVAGDDIVSLPVRCGDALAGAIFLGLPAGRRDHALYPRMKDFAAFLGVALDNLRVLEEVRRESHVDHLTGIHNYRYAMEVLQREIDRARRFGQSFSILMIDLDRFKEFNDRHGHLAGNDALREIAQLFRRSVRSVDTAAKYGGDEFILILPNTDREGAAQLARRLLEEMSRIPPGREHGVSASIGVATCPDDAAQLRDLIECADRALYRAKEEGGGAVGG
jgi:diguanylate cyclase (GGDEF)-like protein